jgi:hypothetical protein
MKELNIEFSEPFWLYGKGNLLWNSPVAYQYGIYLWTIEYQNQYYLEYIGETGKSFFERTHDEGYTKRRKGYLHLERILER